MPESRESQREKLSLSSSPHQTLAALEERPATPEEAAPAAAERASASPEPTATEPVTTAVMSWLQRLFLAAVALSVLDYGSASTVQSSLVAIFFALLAAVAALRPLEPASVRGLAALAVLIVAALIGYAALQALPLASGDFANVAWESVRDHVGPVSGTISVAPGMTLDALPTLAAPFFAFVCALVFFQGDAEALRLWRALAYFGAGYAAFGIVQEMFSPEQLLFETKSFYIGSLTASFVNRNTAGTFCGLAFLLNLGLEIHQLRDIRLSRLVKRTLNVQIVWPDKYALALTHALACLATAVALFLTQSRGAVGATFIAAVVAAGLAARAPGEEAPGQASPWRRRAMALGTLLVVAGLFALLSGRSVYRMEEAGTDDVRWCAFASTIAAVRDNWLLGAGFGTFQDVFPAYRDSGCAGISGVWEHAHNVFLEGWLGLGAPFVLALAVGYAALIAIFVRGARRRRRNRFAPIVGLAALVLATLHSMVDFSLEIPGFAAYFAAATAAAVSLSLGRSRG